MTETSFEYEQARALVLRKRKFRGDVVGYIVINALLIGTWAAAGYGYFWPGWVLAGCGVLLALDGWDAYRRDVTEVDVQRELHKNQ